MAARETRALIAAPGDFYLCPLPQVQLAEGELDAALEAVWSGEQALTSVFREGPKGEPQCIAEGYEYPVALGDDTRWAAFESALNQHTVRVYDLATERVHVDSTSASAYATVTDGGLFQFGHSKDYRPDLPQVKVMLAVLDPLGMPLATDVVSGERADDPLSIPCIERVRASLGRHGLLYVGDCKMAARETRALIAAPGDFYLCPLPQVQLARTRSIFLVLSGSGRVWAGTDCCMWAIARWRRGRRVP